MRCRGLCWNNYGATADLIITQICASIKSELGLITLIGRSNSGRFDLSATDVTNNINDGCISFGCSSSGFLVLCMLVLCHGSLGHWNETSYHWSVTPVFFLWLQDKKIWDFSCTQKRPNNEPNSTLHKEMGIFSHSDRWHILLIHGSDKPTVHFYHQHFKLI